MKATDNLITDHTTIERLLDCLDQAVVRLTEPSALEARHLLEATDFIEHFADQHHHYKEEHILFQALTDRGMPQQGSPVAVMLHEHDQARSYTRDLRAAAERMADGDESARTDAAQAATGYSQLLRQHIFKENNILFPLANQIISSDDVDAIDEEFEQFNQQAQQQDIRQTCLALLDDLEKVLKGSQETPNKL